MQQIEVEPPRRGDHDLVANTLHLGHLLGDVLRGLASLVPGRLAVQGHDPVLDLDLELERAQVPVQPERRLDGHPHRRVAELVLDGLDGAGQPVGSGIYFVKLAAGSGVDTRKIVLLK